MAKAKRRLSDVDVKFISLVGKGANGKTIVWKSDAGYRMPDAGWEKEIPILKVDDEKRVVFGIVYSPDEVDSEGDTMSAAEIEKMAYRFMENRNTDKIDKDHDETPDEGFVAETWLVKKGDPVFADQPAGSWAVGIKVTDDATWKLVKSGKIGGLSMGGEGKATPVEKYSVSSDQYSANSNQYSDKESGFVRRFFKALFGGNKVEKDFKDSFANRTMRDAIWGLSDAMHAVLENGEIEDKQKALIANVNQFIEFINNLESDLMRTDKKTPEKEDLGKVEPGDNGEKKPEGSALEKKIELLEKENAELKARLERLEKAHPGKTAEDSQDGGNKVEKKHKGFTFV